MLNIFGDKKQTPQEVIEDILSDILEAGGFLLSYQFNKTEEENHFRIDIFGEDEGLLKAKEGRLLSALQTYVLRVLYRVFPDEELKIFLDSNGFWEEKQQELMSLVDRLMKKALDSNQPVFLKDPLSPRERRLIHERVSGNTGVRSQSLGEGPYKTMKLIPDTYGRDK